MLLIAIDGASRRNGKPDCVSAGGVFIQEFNSDNKVVHSSVLRVSEKESTNQRGELMALLEALCYLTRVNKEVQILTDSEYIFNAMTKGWPSRWAINGWRTADGDPVKNTDIWKGVISATNLIQKEVSYYHVKGHVIPFGKVTAERSLAYDKSGADLAKQAADQYRRMLPRKTEVIKYAQDLSEKNNGFRFEEGILKRFVVANVVADAVATQAVEEADRYM